MERPERPLLALSRRKERGGHGLEEPDRQDLLIEGIEDQLLGAVTRDARLFQVLDLALETDGTLLVAVHGSGDLCAEIES